MDHCTTIEASKLLGMAVRSVQLMVDRGELEAWKTPGGHRRISRSSIDAWLGTRQGRAGPGRFGGHPAAPPANRFHDRPALGNGLHRPRDAPCVLLIEDSTHFQNLVSLVVRDNFPHADLRVADDGIAGLAMYGQLQPDVLIVDIVLPGIDATTLITSLRSQAEFSRSRLIVVTSLDDERRRPYAFALEHVPVVHKPRLVVDLPPLLARCLAGDDDPARAAPVAVEPHVDAAAT